MSNTTFRKTPSYPRIGDLCFRGDEIKTLSGFIKENSAIPKNSKLYAGTPAYYENDPTDLDANRVLIQYVDGTVITTVNSVLVGVGEIYDNFADDVYVGSAGTNDLARIVSKADKLTTFIVKLDTTIPVVNGDLLSWDSAKRAWIKDAGGILIVNRLLKALDVNKFNDDATVTASEVRFN